MKPALAPLPSVTHEELEELAVALEERITKLNSGGISHPLIICRSLLTAVREAQYSVEPGVTGGE